MDESYASDDWGQDDYNVHEEELVFQDECAERESAELFCDNCCACKHRDTCVDASFDEDEVPEDMGFDQLYE